VIVAGGQESMSLAPHAQHLRAGTKMGDMKMIDTMIKDGLWDAFNGYHMGNTAENVAARSGRSAATTRTSSRHLAEQGRGRAEGRQASRTRSPLHHQGPQGRHHRRPGRIYPPWRDARQHDQAAPAFDKDGTVTAANASGINDGAAAVLMSAEEAVRRGITPLARIVSWATAGVDPQIMGTGPIPASRKALEKAGWSVGDLDLIEANEAFAAQACAVNKDLGWDPRSSTSMAAPSPSATRSAPRAPASSTRCCSR
jgi:acetyl-CoA C-acetyltransferase